MKHYLGLQMLVFCWLLSTGCNSIAQKKPNFIGMEENNKFLKENPFYSKTDTSILNVSDEKWKQILAPDLYAVARQKATERAFTGKLYENDVKGNYYCAVCGHALFKSTSKFSSSCGWPSFFESITPRAVKYIEDNSYGIHRIEVLCGRCDSHLGHIFDDGPAPTHKRFCMNSISLDFEPE